VVAPVVALAGKAAAKKAASSKVGKAVIALCLAILIGVPVGGIGVILLGLQVIAGSAADACPSVSGSVDLAKIPAGPIAGFDHDQLVAAGNIMKAATKLGLDGRAQQLGVMTAIGESTLRPLEHGDGAINPDGTVATSIGYFQQQDDWGTREQRLDAFQSATLFYQRLPGVEGWETMEPTLAANAVQGNLDPYYYVPFWEPAGQVVTELAKAAGAGGPAGGTCSVPGDAKALAQELVVALDSGKLVGSTPDHMKEIRWIAEGQNMPDCGIDTRILQVIVLAVRNFDQVGISDINRKCTGQIEGAGEYSSHYVNGGGHAVDFYLLNGQSLPGADENTLKFIKILDPIMPPGSGLGQANCRAAAGISLPLQNFHEFSDSCSHMHVDVGGAGDGQLRF